MEDIRALIVEDSERDAALLLRALRKAGYEPVCERVESPEEMAAALDGRQWDIVLSDYVLPSFGGLAALAMLHERALDLPFIVVSGQIGEDVAAGAMRAGAHDYIMKGNLKRLGPAIKRELAEAENRKLRRQAEEDVRRSAAELRVLAHRLLQVQEDERRNIARELHDEIGQQLTILKLLLERTGKAIGDNPPEQLATAREMTVELLQRVREMSLRLRPGSLDELGLLPALQQHLQDFQKKTGIAIDFQHSGLERELPQEVCTCAYRIVQETLTNIVRHAKATQVTVSARANDGTLAIEVKDNGVGFNPAEVSAKSSGLRGIRERAQYLSGSAVFESSPGKGVTVKVSLPLGR